jgi:hypothetical protein
VNREQTITTVVLSVVYAVSYGLSCWWFPFKNCGCCHGKGSHNRKDGKVFRACGGIRCLGFGCGATGKKRRLGRTVYVFARRIVRDAS